MTTPENTPPTTAVRRRRPRGIYPRTPDSQPQRRERKLPVYLDQSEVNALIAAAPNHKARLLMRNSGGPDCACPRPWPGGSDLHLIPSTHATVRNAGGRVDRRFRSTRNCKTR